MPSAYPQLVRCAKHQLREDAPMYAYLLDEHTADYLIRPNLLLMTGPPRSQYPSAEHGTLVPVLSLKAG